jgi:glucosamine-6-phosphate deaminase
VQVRIFPDAASLATAAAEQAARSIRNAIQTQGRARIVAASAASQIAFLYELSGCPAIDWQRVELFQLDEYIGLPITHPASFCRFLQEHLIARTGLRNYHPLDGMTDPMTAIRNVGQAVAALPIDLAFLGIGENGHLAFNDPPADFDTDEPYLAVRLDESCRRQQVGEGWFCTLSEVPTQAITMSICQILKAREIVTVVPDLRKARAVQLCLEAELGPMHPASALRSHPNATVYLDKQSASLLKLQR